MFIYFIIHLESKVPKIPIIIQNNLAKKGLNRNNLAEKGLTRNNLAEKGLTRCMLANLYCFCFCLLTFFKITPRKYGTGLGSNSRPLELLSDKHLLSDMPRY